MRKAALFLAGILASGTAALAQQDQGTITGTITDSTGAVIPGASITARETGTNVTLLSSSNEGGVRCCPSPANATVATDSVAQQTAAERSVLMNVSHWLSISRG